eukprot:362572_1
MAYFSNLILFFMCNSAKAQLNNTYIIPTVLCLEYEVNDEYSVWSGIYESKIGTNNTTMNNYILWQHVVDDKEYNIMYSNSDQTWIIAQNINVYDDTMIDYISKQNVIAICNEQNISTTNPTLCDDWMVMESFKIDNNTDIMLTDISGSNQCKTPIISTTITVVMPPNLNHNQPIVGVLVISATLLIAVLCIVVLWIYIKKRQYYQHLKTDYPQYPISLHPLNHIVEYKQDEEQDEEQNTLMENIELVNVTSFDKEYSKHKNDLNALVKSLQMGNMKTILNNFLYLSCDHNTDAEFEYIYSQINTECNIYNCDIFKRNYRNRSQDIEQ